MRRNKRKNKYMLLIVILLSISIGFAAMATTLKIDGFASVLKPTWKVYWANPQVTTGSVTNTLPTISENEGEPERTKLSWTTTLSLPGDFYEFTVDAINTGSVDAMITGIFPTVTDGTNVVALPDYIDYSVTYADGTKVELNQVLQANSTQKYKVRVSYDMQKMTSAEIEAMPATGLSYTFRYEVTYGLLTDQAVKPDLRFGEYFILYPDKATATTTTPGFSGSTPTKDQYLWRVINLNPDGTIDAVADSASSKTIRISGEDGYTYYIAGLQDIASCYTKKDYTVKTRMMGYNGQTPVLEDTYAYNGTNYTAPSETSTPTPTEGEGVEYGNGLLGDTLYLRDYQLVQQTYKSVSASSGGSYWLASRAYVAGTNKFYFNGNTVNGSIGSVSFRYYGDSRYSYSITWRDGDYSNNNSFAVRPIITIRSGLHKESGKGSKSNPYRLNSRNGWFLTNSMTPLLDQKSEYWLNGSKIMNGWRYDLTDLSGRPNTYYFKDGYAYHGWLELDGKKYYLSEFDDDSNGYIDHRRFNGETREIDGVEYTFDANGVCTNCD